uniref:Putative conserved plasma membrane protein n=1 Tax=Rhipicephalus microplus TaxID=6941 RepID=A0A6M2D1B2_RHIMP
MPANFIISSAHLIFCLPLTCLPSLGIQSGTLNDQWLSCVRATCPAHVHFVLISTMISFMPVCPLIYSVLFLSLKVTPIIFLSIARCVVLNLIRTLFVGLSVSAP